MDRSEIQGASVAKGFKRSTASTTQRRSPVVKYVTLRVIAITKSNNWPLDKLDVVTFLYGVMK
uniref:Uncharacterized protein n=1 Tax=Peronospora matthiolae TaxID=2874970 RepID=A0AAV1V729_9STRA